jgi:hypothetical protein
VTDGVGRLVEVERVRYRRLWAYNRNPMVVRAATADDASGSGRPYVQGQEWGLPARITGVRSGRAPGEGSERAGTGRKEVVVENDIAWRVDTMVDYLFGREVGIESAAEVPARKDAITRVLKRVLADHGGILFLQQLALIGSVYGFVDVVVKLDCGRVAEFFDGQRREAAAVPDTADAAPPLRTDGGETGGVGGGEGGGAVADAAPPSPSGGTGAGEERAGQARRLKWDVDVEAVARCVRLEIVEPTRAVPILSDVDWRVVEAYGQVWERDRGTGRGARGEGKTGGFLARWMESAFGTERPRGIRFGGRGDRATVVEVISATRWQRYEDEVLVGEGVNSLGRVPVVHVQNVAVPFEYAGASDVEPLIALQDELNTRLSDRANRITLQSFKMYLGKGIDGFNTMPVAPGRMWATDNDQADVVEFGGDANCPSEDAHIDDVREALDKSSAVTPIAAGAIKNRIGRLTSAAALRITLLALLSKTDKKRTSYGGGIRQICGLALAWLDVAGVFKTDERERGVELHWPSPLPENEMEKLQEGEAKLRLGVAKEVVLRELGY